MESQILFCCLFWETKNDYLNYSPTFLPRAMQTLEMRIWDTWTTDFLLTARQGFFTCIQSFIIVRPQTKIKRTELICGISVFYSFFFFLFVDSNVLPTSWTLVTSTGDQFKLHTLNKLRGHGEKKKLKTKSVNGETNCLFCHKDLTNLYFIIHPPPLKKITNRGRGGENWLHFG